jgi:hypothetical protein
MSCAKATAVLGGGGVRPRRAGWSQRTHQLRQLALRPTADHKTTMRKQINKCTSAVEETMCRARMPWDAVASDREHSGHPIGPCPVLRQRALRRAGGTGRLKPRHFVHFERSLISGPALVGCLLCLKGTTLDKARFLDSPPVHKQVNGKSQHTYIVSFCTTRVSLVLCLSTAVAIVPRPLWAAKALVFTIGTPSTLSGGRESASRCQKP